MDPTALTEQQLEEMSLEDLRAACDALGSTVLDQADTEQGRIAHALLNFGQALIQSRETVQESQQAIVDDPEQAKSTILSAIYTMVRERPLKDIHASMWANDDPDEYRRRAEEAERGCKEVRAAAMAAKAVPARNQPAAKPANPETANKKEKTTRRRRHRKPTAERSLARQEQQATQPVVHQQSAPRQPALPVVNQQPVLRPVERNPNPGLFSIRGRGRERGDRGRGQMQNPHGAPQQPARPMPAPPMPAQTSNAMLAEMISLISQQTAMESEREAERTRLQSEREAERIRLESQKVQIELQKLELEKMKLGAQQEKDRAEERKSQMPERSGRKRSRHPSPAYSSRFEYRESTASSIRSPSGSPSRLPIPASKRSRVGSIFPSFETGARRGFGTSSSWTPGTGTTLPAIATAAPFVPTGPRQSYAHPALAYASVREDSRRQRKINDEKAKLAERLAAVNAEIEALTAVPRAAESSRAPSLPLYEESPAPAPPSQTTYSSALVAKPESEGDSDQGLLHRQLPEE
ncbi:hypothetical protein MMC30_005796 [Trapelia coarctata]|nr:hypothetical protein [Trapelia coarctata]